MGASSAVSVLLPERVNAESPWLFSLMSESSAASTSVSGNGKYSLLFPSAAGGTGASSDCVASFTCK